MKTLWARVGMEIEISDEEYEKIKDNTEEIVTRAINENRFTLNGETYFPVLYDCGDDYDNLDEEIECNL